MGEWILTALINELMHRITQTEKSQKITQAFLEYTLMKIMFVYAKMIDIPGPFESCVLQ